MKTILTLLFSIATITLFAQLPSDKIFQKYKDAKDVSYTAANQNGKDSVTGKPIPMHMRTLTVETDNPLYKTILADCEKIIHYKDYSSMLTTKDDGSKTDIEKYDKGKKFEILVLTRGEDAEVTLLSVSAENLTEAQKKQISIKN